MKHCQNHVRAGRAGLLHTLSVMGLTAVLAMGGAQAALAQTAPEGSDAAGDGTENAVVVNDIVVTARKRSETSLATPVTVQAVGSADLERTNTQDVIGLARRVPGLQVYSGTSGAGGQVTLRGVGNTSATPSIDQAVSFIVDGVGAGSANVVRFGQVDLEQVEILKGPQALFFGKNSPGGIINIVTKDPGASFEFKGSVAHEIYAGETSGEIILSGPLSDTLGVRLVGFARHMDGYNKDRTPYNGVTALGSLTHHNPMLDEYMLRATLLFEPSNGLRVRAKYSYGHSKGSSPYATSQRIYCPYGTPQGAGAPNPDPCRADNITYSGAIFPYVERDFGDAFPFIGLKASQHLGSLDVSYGLSDQLNFTSVTGYYRGYDYFRGNTNIAPTPLLIAGTTALRREISEEMRLTTDFDNSPVNFMVGGFFQDLHIRNFTPVVVDAFAALAPGNPARPPSVGIAGVMFPKEVFTIDGRTYSAFAQAIWQMTDDLELSGGARYTHETKLIDYVRNDVRYDTLFPRRVYEDVSPEVTLSYRPRPSLNIFGGYREGFISGGFNTGNPADPRTNDITFRPSRGRGFEGGVKAQLGGLRLDFAAYRYNYSDLQVSTFDPVAVGLRLLNAGTARVQGLELSGRWRADSVAGLELFATVNYNHARYREFFAGCYTGQTVAGGCNVNPGPTGRFQQQDLTGRQLLFAPDWTGNAGFIKDFDLGDGTISISGDVNYSSSYFAQLEQAPEGKQGDYAMVNASVRFRPPGERLEFSIVGKNLTNVYRSTFVSQAVLTGNPAFSGTANGSGRSDLSGQVWRGREISVRATLNF